MSMPTATQRRHTCGGNRRRAKQNELIVCRGWRCVSEPCCIWAPGASHRKWCVSCGRCLRAGMRYGGVCPVDVLTTVVLAPLPCSRWRLQPQDRRLLHRKSVPEAPHVVASELMMQLGNILAGFGVLRAALHLHCPCYTGFVSYGVRTHAELPPVDLKSTPLATRAN